MPRTARQQTGESGEAAALAFLEQRGLTLIARNVSSVLGEIDLIMRDANVVVFVEVRVRRTIAYGGAAASVTPAKQARLRRQSLAWLKQRFGDHHWPACRFDVLAIDAGRPDWIRDAF